METIFSNIKERVLQIAEYKGVAKEKFFEQLGVTYGNFKGEAKKKALSSDTLATIVSIYPDINTDWLLMGLGSMLKETKSLKTDSSLSKSTNNVHTGIPVLPFDAFAGSGVEILESLSFDKIAERYNVPLFDGLKVDFMIPVKGSSMYPKYNSGDVVACRSVKELLFVQWNKTYVLDTLSQGTIIKRLKKSVKEEFVICKSDNKDYDEFELPLSDIRNIALVVGVIRLE